MARSPSRRCLEHKKAIFVQGFTVLLISILLLCGSACSTKSSAFSHCLNTLRALDGSFDSYSLDHNGDFPVSMDEMLPYISFKCVCHEGGKYSIDSQGVIRCSIHGSFEEFMQQ